MTAPPEVCPEHDLRIDQYGCWACGHAGPLTDEVLGTWQAWAAGRMSQALAKWETDRSRVRTWARACGRSHPSDARAGHSPRASLRSAP